jgi:hypothetical protein
MCKMHDPRNEAILYRLPKTELLVLGSMACPVENQDKTETKQQVINASKALR